jgi:thiol-disulfide isomerase/thioredoxin
MDQQSLSRTAIRRRLTLAAVAVLFPIAAAPAAEELGAGQARLAPPCALTLSTGQPVDFGRFRGQVLYVDFWASWCGPCLLSFPFMNELQRTYGDKGLHVLAVNMDEKPADAARFLGQHPATFDVANGPNGQCAKDFGVATMPTSFLVDRSGTVRVVHKGFRTGDIDELKAKLEGLIAESGTGPEAK